MSSTCMIRVTHIKCDISNVRKHTHTNSHSWLVLVHRREFALFDVFEFKKNLITHTHAHTYTHSHTATQPHSQTDTLHTETHRETHRDTETHRDI